MANLAQYETSRLVRDMVSTRGPGDVLMVPEFEF